MIGRYISSYGVVFYENISSSLAYVSGRHSESMAMRPEVTYTTCATSSREQTGDIITFAQFEEVNILTKTRKNAESVDKSNDDSTMPPLLNEEEMDAMGSGDQ